MGRQTPVACFFASLTLPMVSEATEVRERLSFFAYGLLR